MAVDRDDERVLRVRDTGVGAVDLAQDKLGIQSFQDPAASASSFNVHQVLRDLGLFTAERYGQNQSCFH